MPKIKRPPKLSRHKASGQAYVTWQYQRIYLGEYGSKEASANYARFLTSLVDLDSAEPDPKPDAPKVGWVTVTELCAAYRQFAQGYYQRDGAPTVQYTKVKQRIRILIDHSGKLPVNEFSAKRLKTIQAALVDQGLSRVGVNERIDGIRRIFRWGESEDLVPKGTEHNLKTVQGVAQGRTKAREMPPVLPVDDATVDGTLPFCPPVVADLIRFQRYTGCRPGEACIVRPCDIDRSGAVWVYTPSTHKTAYRGRSRTIFVGPRAQEVLRPYLLRPADAYCFQPAESEKRRREEVHELRVTPLSCGNTPGSNLAKHPARPAGDHYVKDSYARAIARAVRKANKDRREKAEDGEEVVLLESWSPNRLRHTAATEIRHKFGLEAAQVALGHAKANITETYAERDAELARTVAMKIG
jgi:integrase